MVTAIVVDDDFDTVEVFSEFLNLRNIEILGKAYNGLDGIKLFEETRPDIVFSDVSMPEYDGFYLLKNLKKSYPDSKIIMVTADMTLETDTKLKEFNADAVIFKPFKINTIIDVVEQISKSSIPISNRF
jgi:CheY-like chemotaxis protein